MLLTNQLQLTLPQEEDFRRPLGSDRHPWVQLVLRSVTAAKAGLGV